MRALLCCLLLTGCLQGGSLGVVGNGSNGTNPNASNTDECANLGTLAFCENNVAVECEDGSVVSRLACEPSTTVCVEGACEDCTPTIETEAGSDTLWLALDPHGVGDTLSQSSARKVTVTATGGGTLDVAGDGVMLLDEALNPLQIPLALESGTRALFVLPTALGSATLTLAPNDPCAVGEARLNVSVTTMRGLTGRPLAGYPHFEFVSTFNEGDAVYTALDPTYHPDLAGRTIDVYLVQDKSAEQWATTPKLSDVRGAPSQTTIVVDSTNDNLHELWTGNAVEGVLTEAFDVVYDVDGDGQLGPGDLVDGLHTPGLVVVSDLTRAGPLDPVSFEYSESYWSTMRIYAPNGIQTMSPLPLVVISHGNGHDYRWYDYLGLHLASWGYVVMSHRNDTVPGTVTAAVTTRENTDIFLRDLGDIGEGLLEGKIDASNITWIGHSRGGEGVVLAYDDLREGDASASNYGWQDIQVVSSIAPVIFEGPDEADPHDVTYHLLAGSSDGDVTGGPNSSGVQYFRIFRNREGDGLVTYVQGASHNDFNCCGTNDGYFTSGPGELIGPEAAQATAKSYYLALLEWKIKGNLALAEYFGRMPSSFKPSAATPTLSNIWMPEIDSGHSVVIDNFQANPDNTLSSSGGGVRYTVSNLYEGILEDAGSNLGWVDADPMNGMTWAEDDGPNSARGVVFDFDGQAAIEFDVPTDASDMRRGGWLSLRVCQGTRHPNTVALNGALDFSVILKNSDGEQSAINAARYGNIPPPFARTGLGSGTGWVNEFSTVRVPLMAFTTDRPDFQMAEVTQVVLQFGGAGNAAIGRVGLDDLEIVWMGDSQ